ncbi:MAG: radical SAM protein [Archaeoglobales archaeon]|nr:MAG: radical SAM protein [Archaeoglobales archaeon]
MEIVLTAPATEMSNHHGKEFLGFGTCSPPTVAPSWFIKMFFYPKVRCKNGEVTQAPYGLRKVEALLIDAGFDVLTVHPYDIEDHLKDVKVVGISVMDPLGFGPVSVTFSAMLDGEPSTRTEFLNLMEKIEPYDVKVIVGGAGAWQFEWDEYWKEKIDCIVIGEGEGVVVDVFRKALRGERLPKVVFGKPVSVDKIPTIKKPSINGLIEISRGCGRGCKFCSETLKVRRDIPIDKIVEEARVCVGETRSVILHSEDVLMYGCKDPKFVPNEEKVLNLFRAVKEVSGYIGVSHCSLAAVVAKPSIVEGISEIVGVGERVGMFGVQTGLETGSERLMERHMHGKCLPFHPREWCDVVESSFSIMHDNRWIPAATLIIGLPGETEDDVIKTIELVERLRDYCSLIVPLIFIPMEVCALRRERLFTRENLKDYHYELMAVCMDHNVHWIDKLIKEYFKGYKNLPIKFGYWIFSRWVKKNWGKMKKDLKLTVRSLIER